MFACCTYSVNYMLVNNCVVLCQVIRAFLAAQDGQDFVDHLDHRVLTAGQALLVFQVFLEIQEVRDYPDLRVLQDFQAKLVYLVSIILTTFISGISSSSIFSISLLVGLVLLLSMAAAV